MKRLLPTSSDSPWYAKAVASKIVETAQAIPEYPELGRVVPEIGDAAIRERLVHRYRLIYRIKPQRVIVAAVIHGRQDFEPYLARLHDNPDSL